MSKFSYISEMCRRITTGIENHHYIVTYNDRLLCRRVLEILEAEEWIESWYVEEKKIKIMLRYKNKECVISRIKAYARPEKIVPLRMEELKVLDSPFHTLILSTSKGVISGKDAFNLKIGGILLAEVR